MATINTGGTAAAWSPDQFAFAAKDVLGDALLQTHATVLGTIHGDEPSLRVAYVDDDTAEVVAEGADLSEAAPTLSEAVVSTIKVAQLLRVTNEQFQQPGTATELSASVARAIQRKADELFISSSITGGPTGIDGIAGVEDGGDIGTDLDALVDLVATVQGNGANPTGIILGPEGWAAMRKLKTATGANTTLLGAGTDDAVPRVLGIPVTVNPAVQGTNGYVVDRSAIVAAAGNVNVTRSEHRYFDSDSVGLRATHRIGWNVTRADRLGKFTIGDAS